MANIPDADDGRELEPHALETASWDLSLPEVDGLGPPPPDDGRPVTGELAVPSVYGEDTADDAHALGVGKDDLLPHVSVPL